MKVDLTTLRVNEEFRALLPALTESEREELRHSIERDGVRDSVMVWKDAGELWIVDGHHRVEICLELGIECPVIEHPFDDRKAVTTWMLLNQLGRRNLRPRLASELRGRLYNSQAGPRGGDRRSKSRIATLDTASTVAKATGVSRATVLRDAEYVDNLDCLTPELKGQARSAKLTRVDVKQLAEASGSTQEAVSEQLAAGTTAAEAIATACSPAPCRQLTPHERAEAAMKTTNTAVRSWALSVTAMAKQLPATPHLSPTERDLVANQLKAAAGTARRAVGVTICWHCHGEGCKWCRKTGYFTQSDKDCAPLEGDG